MKIVLSIAGSDSSGGAGIQADIKSGFYHKVFMTTAITAVTVQNTLGVTDVVVLKPEFVVKQIKSVIEDFKVNCIKIGMLSSKELIFEVFETIKDLNIPIVLDPVAISRAGSKLLDDEAINSLKSNFKYAYLITPNSLEAKLFFDVENINDIKNLKDEGNFTSLNLILNQEESLEKAEQLNSKIDSLKRSLDQYLNDIEAITNDLKSDLSAGIFSRNVKNAEDVYRETISSLEQSGVSFDDHARLLHEQSELLSVLDEIKDYKQQREAIDQKIKEVYEEIILIRKSISLARQEFIQENFSNLSNVKVKLLPFGVMKESAFREVIDKKDNVFISSIYDDEEEKGILFNLLKAIKEQENLESASDLIISFKQSLLSEPLGQDILDNCEKRLIDHLYTMQRHENFALNLLSWFPEDDLIIEFKNKSGNFQAIHKGSAGQKSATILSLLLSFGDEPLILDQPEDDLDNSLITDLIVEKVKERKIHRQIIVVTHNPNIVVNGDSEKIISLDNRGVIQVSSHGALQTKEVRSEVCKIMEGGIQALEKRYNRMIRLDQ